MLLEGRMVVPLLGVEVLTGREHEEASELLVMLMYINRPRCKRVHDGKIHGLNTDDVCTFLYIKTTPVPKNRKHCLSLLLKSFFASESHLTKLNL